MWTVQLVGLDLSHEEHRELLASAEGSRMTMVAPEPDEIWWSNDACPTPLQFKWYVWGSALTAQARVTVVRCPAAGGDDDGDRTTTLAVARATADDEGGIFSAEQVKEVVLSLLPAPWDGRVHRWTAQDVQTLVAAFQ